MLGYRASGQSRSGVPQGRVKTVCVRAYRERWWKGPGSGAWNPQRQHGCPESSATVLALVGFGEEGALSPGWGIVHSLHSNRLLGADSLPTPTKFAARARNS